MLNGRQGRNIICLIIPTYVFPGLKTHICKFKIRTERKKENQKRGKNKTREIKKLKVHNIKAISSVQLSLSVLILNLQICVFRPGKTYVGIIKQIIFLPCLPFSIL